MNHGIKVVLHDAIPQSDIHAKPGLLHRTLGRYEALEEEAVVAEVLCMRRHDDERTARFAQECKIIHVWPWGSMSLGAAIFDPDPMCVTKRTAALKKWNAVNTLHSDRARSAPSVS